MSLILAVLMALLAPGVIARAGDGALEINQECIATGCFPGDTGGFPVQITIPGHFLLTSNLEIPPGPTGPVIEVSRNNVRIDLGGFSIRGGTVCSDTGAVPNAVTCTPGGAATIGILVLANAVPYRGIVIRNGVIQGMLVAGVDGREAEGLAVEDVHVRYANGPGMILPHGASLRRSTVLLTGADGITVGWESLVESVIVRASGAAGIVTGRGSRITRALSVENTNFGMRIGNDSAVHDSSVRSNGLDGLLAGYGTRLDRVTANLNAGNGIFFDQDGSLSGGAVRLNGGDGIHCMGICRIEGASVAENGGDGIEVTGGSSTLLRNTINSNQGFGINTVGGTALYDQNNLSGNGPLQTSFTDGGGVSGGANHCNGAAC